MGKLVQFGAGNIGRSFIGQVFAKNGYEVVFVDVDTSIIDGLNAAGSYRLVIKHPTKPDETVTINGVRAVDARDAQRVTAEVARADYVSTSVGQGALGAIIPVIATGIDHRRQHGQDTPIDIIIAENIRDGATYFRTHLEQCLGIAPDASREHSWFPGLVETSIGKMVPIMTAADREADPLQVFAEPYNTLIVDRWAFKRGVPEIPEILAVDNIKAYVDRKLFIHNLGHAATAYLGFRADNTSHFIWQALLDDRVREGARRAMAEAAEALNRAYPEDLSQSHLREHIDDLLQRFENRSLGDTVYRVGRDLRRKLGRNDRVLGAARLCETYGTAYGAIGDVFHAGLCFEAADETGAPFQDDVAFLRQARQMDMAEVLHGLCGLEPENAIDQAVLLNLSS